MDGDQATYELPVTTRNKRCDKVSNVILLLGDFHLAEEALVGRRADGHHNGVSPDMLLEQTHNVDAKEESYFDGIRLNVAAGTNRSTQSLLSQSYLLS